MGFLPYLCHVKYKGNSLNSKNNAQKSEFQDKGREESDKVERNIPNALAYNGTTVMIRARIL